MYFIYTGSDFFSLNITILWTATFNLMSSECAESKAKWWISYFITGWFFLFILFVSKLPSLVQCLSQPTEWHHETSKHLLKPAYHSVQSSYRVAMLSVKSGENSWRAVCFVHFHSLTVDSSNSYEFEWWLVPFSNPCRKIIVWYIFFDLVSFCPW